MRWNRNEPLAEKRSVLIYVQTDDGDPAPATTLFTGTNELLVEKGDGHFIAPLGELLNTDRRLEFADQEVSGTDTVGDTLTINAHGLLTGDGPVQFVQVGGSLPGGIVAATDYWVIVVDVDTIQVAETLEDALAGTFIDLTSVAVETSIVDTASTKRLNDGLFRFVAAQNEINYRGDHFGIRISKAGFRESVTNVDLVDAGQLHAGTAQAGAAGSITLDAGASATNDAYNDCLVIIVGGMGAGQVNTITDYAGGTNVATVARNWAIVPDATSEFVVAPAPSGANPTSVATAVWSAIGEGAHSYGDLVRGLVGVLAGPSSGYDAGTIEAKSLNGAKVRFRWTTDQTGRVTVLPVDLT